MEGGGGEGRGWRGEEGGVKGGGGGWMGRGRRVEGGEGRGWRGRRVEGGEGGEGACQVPLASASVLLSLPHYLPPSLPPSLPQMTSMKCSLTFLKKLWSSTVSCAERV